MKGLRLEFGALGALFVMTTSVAWGETEPVDDRLSSLPVLLDPLMVSAELIDRSLQESGNSAVIFDESALDKQPGVTTLRDALDVIPNMSVVTGTGKAPSVRGVDGTGPAENANAFFAGSRPRLSWQIDGRPASYNEVVFSDLGLYDVERVEVLRGPQSTLVGRNSIAGTVVVNTRDPEFQPDGAVRLGAGNDGQRQVSGMVNAPIAGDLAALRLTADWLEKESAVSYDPFPGVDDPGKISGLATRAKLLLTPDTARYSRWLFTVSHSEYAGPNGEIIVKPFSDRRSNFPEQPQHENKTTSLVVDYLQELGNQWDFKMNASASDLGFVRRTAQGPSNSSATVDTRAYVLEPRLHYKSDGATAVAGLYYYRARQDEYIAFFGGQNFDDRTDTLAGYAEGIVPITDQLDLALGLRYEEERRKRDGGDPARTLVNVYSDETYQVLLPKAGLSWYPSDGRTWGVQVSKGYNAGGGGVTFASPIVNYEYDEETAWTYELFGRQQFADGRIRTTQNLFHSVYDDMQLPFDLTPDDSTDEAFVVRNAGKVESWGVELGLDASITDHLDIWASAGFLKTEIVSYPDSGVEGNQLLTAPDFTGNVGVSWEQGNWQASLAARYSDEYFTDVNNRRQGKTDPYVVSDARLAYRLGDWRVYANVKNLFDSEDAVARYPHSTDSALDTAVLLQPRTFLIGVEWNYGG